VLSKRSAEEFHRLPASDCGNNKNFDWPAFCSDSGIEFAHFSIEWLHFDT